MKKKAKIILILYSILMVAYFLLLPILDQSRHISRTTLFNRFNLIPLKNTLDYLLNHNRFNVMTILKNTLFVIFMYFPVGFLGKKGLKYSFIRQSLFLIISLVVLYGLRAFLAIGYFDIDKIILAYLGFCLGYLLASNFKKRKRINHD